MDRSDIGLAFVALLPRHCLNLDNLYYQSIKTINSFYMHKYAPEFPSFQRRALNSSGVRCGENTVMRLPIFWLIEADPEIQ